MNRGEFGSFLKRLRVARGVKLLTAAEAVGVSLSTWGHWETGRRQPLLGHILAAAEFLGVYPQCLMCGKNRECPDAARNPRDQASGENPCRK